MVILHSPLAQRPAYGVVILNDWHCRHMTLPAARMRHPIARSCVGTHILPYSELVVCQESLTVDVGKP